MVENFYLYSRSSVYSGAEIMLLNLARGIHSVSRSCKIHLTHSSSDFNTDDETSIYKNTFKPGLKKISEKPHFLLVYFLLGFLKLFGSSIRKKNAIFIFNDLESLIIDWPLALFNESYFYLHDSHKTENFKARFICKIISFLVDNLLVITSYRLKILNSIGIKNVIHFPNCTLRTKVENKRKSNLKEIHCICVAQIATWKRIDQVIELFNSLAVFNPDKNWYLHICGRASQFDKEGLQLELDLIQCSDNDERITFHGYVKNIDHLMEQCQLLLSMSENEPFGLALVEAIQKGCYILSSEGEGPDEIVSSDFIGKIIPNGYDINEWARTNSESIFINMMEHFEDRVHSSDRYSFDNYKSNIKNTWFAGYD